MSKYRILCDPNELDYRRFTVQRRRFFVWRNLTHRHPGGLPVVLVSRFGTLEEARERIERDVADRAPRLPIEVVDTVIRYPA